jgi:UrcA family protein
MFEEIQSSSEKTRFASTLPQDFGARCGGQCRTRALPGPQLHLENHMTLKTALDHSATCALFCTIALVVIGATLPLPAAADPPGSRQTPETATKVISLSGLDLATPQGQREARLRLAKARGAAVPQAGRRSNSRRLGSLFSLHPGGTGRRFETAHPLHLCPDGHPG